MFGLEEYVPPRITKTALYRVVGWTLRIYVLALLIVGGYSVLWALEVAGLVPEVWLSAIWIAIAVMGCLFLVLLVPLFYSTRSTNRPR